MADYATPPFAPESKSTSASLAADLGQVYKDAEGRLWKVVKATAAVSNPEGKILRFSDASANEVDGTAPGSLAQVAGQVSPSWSSSVDIASGDYLLVQCGGPMTLTKANTVVILTGQEVWYDGSAGKGTHSRVAGDFPIGVALEDAAITATSCLIDFGKKQTYQVDLRAGSWTTEATDGLGVSAMVGGAQKLAFDAVAEVAQAALFSDITVAKALLPIMEAEVAIFDIADAAAVDFTVGLANGSHATDFQSVTEFATIHLDGAALDIKVQSDDGTTDVAPVDSTLNAVDDTYFFVQIDTRDMADVQIYVNGADAVPAGTTLVLTAAAGAFKPIAHMEKTSDDTTAEMRVREMRVYGTVAAA